MKAAEYASLEYQLDNPVVNQIVFEYDDGEEKSNVDGLELSYNGTKPKNGTIVVNTQGKLALAITDGVYCAEKDFEETEVVITTVTNEEDCKLEIDLVEFNTIIDERDGKTYQTVKIGNQVWFAENLRYTGNGCLENDWSSDTNAANACCEHTQDWGTEVYYQWRAAMNGSTTEGSQGLCPAGWHVPTDEEWGTLIEHVGSNAGLKLKSTNYWNDGGNGTNEVGFNWLPTGFLSSSGGLLYLVGYNGVFLSSSGDSSTYAWNRNASYSNDGVDRYNISLSDGDSVRCVRD